MANFSASISLTGLSGSTGARVFGEANGDNAGISISSAGDVNGDGIEDFIVGSVWSDRGGSNAGTAYVVFGTASGFPSNFNLSTIDGTNGFRIVGASPSGMLGTGVGGGGDINGDGYDDVVVGAYGVNPYAQGAAYVIFGHAGAFASAISVSSLNGANGFAIPGAARNDFTGGSVDIAGDVNGDGYDDFVVGAQYATGLSSDRGAAYLVFGHGGSFTSSFSLAGLNGTNGTQFLGVGSADNAGFSVRGAGDFNGDGLQDLIIGAPGASNGVSATGGAYIVFGSGTSFGATFDLSTLTGANGLKLVGAASGDKAGISVASAGDINGDGYDDVIVGATLNDANGVDSGASYVVFGKASGFSATLNLASLDGTNGFKIFGTTGGTRLGSAAAGGDINGDGYDDVIVSAANDTSNGGFSGATFVVFGHGGAFASSFNITTLDGTNGFKALGPNSSFSGKSVGTADVNGDGVQDLLVGAPTGLSQDGLTSPGVAYVVYGQPTAVTWTGGAGDETRNGGTLDDTLSGGAGKDVLNGRGGADILNGDDGNDTLSGGDGADTLHGGLNNDIVGGDAGDDTLYGDAGNDKVNGGDGVDHLYGGDGADLMNGGTGNDVLDGGAGNDTLDGGTGADAMSGGAGNDVYYVDDEGDTTVEQSGEGVDIVRSTISWTLGANVESLQLLGSALVGTGNELANNIQGNALSNILIGGGGVDTINGGDGNDSISGGTGNDILYGGAGADTFAVAPESLYSSKTPAGGHLEIDFVRDFSTAEGDKLNLGSIDADSTVGGDQAFHLVSAFTRHGGEMTLVYNATANLTVMSLDVDGDGKADYQMKINGDVHLDSGGWIL